MRWGRAIARRAARSASASAETLSTTRVNVSPAMLRASLLNHVAPANVAQMVVQLCINVAQFGDQRPPTIVGHHVAVRQKCADRSQSAAVDAAMLARCVRQEAPPVPHYRLQSETLAVNGRYRVRTWRGSTACRLWSPRARAVVGASGQSWRRGVLYACWRREWRCRFVQPCHDRTGSNHSPVITGMKKPTRAPQWH